MEEQHSETHAEPEFLNTNLCYLDLNQIENSNIEKEVTNSLALEENLRRITGVESENGQMRSEIVRIQMELEKAGEDCNHELSLRTELIDPINLMKESKEEIMHILDQPETRYRRYKAEGRLFEDILRTFRMDMDNYKCTEAELIATIEPLLCEIASISRCAEQEDKDFFMAEESKRKLAAESHDLKMKWKSGREMEVKFLEEKKMWSAEVDRVHTFGIEQNKRLSDLKNTPTRTSAAVTCETKLAEDRQEQTDKIKRLQDELDNEYTAMNSSQEELEEVEAEYVESVELVEKTEEEYWSVSHQLESLIEENISLDVQDDQEAGILSNELAALEGTEVVIQQEEAGIKAQLENCKANCMEITEAIRNAQETSKKQKKDQEELFVSNNELQVNTVEIEEGLTNLEDRIAQLYAKMKEMEEQAEADVCHMEECVNEEERLTAESSQLKGNLEARIGELSEKHKLVRAVLDEAVKKTKNYEENVSNIEVEEQKQNERFEKEIKSLNDIIASLSSVAAPKKTSLDEYSSQISDMGDVASLEEDLRILQERIEFENEEKKSSNANIKNLGKEEERLLKVLRKFEDELDMVKKSMCDDEKDMNRLLAMLKEMDSQKETIAAEKEQLDIIKRRDGPRFLLAEKDKIEEEYETILRNLENEKRNLEAKKLMKKEKQEKIKVNPVEQWRQSSQNPIKPRKPIAQLHSIAGERSLSQPSPRRDPEWFRASQLPATNLQNEQVSSSSNVGTTDDSFRFRVPAAAKASKKKLYFPPSPSKVIDLDL